jgi:hypothetical protein
MNLFSTLPFSLKFLSDLLFSKRKKLSVEDFHKQQKARVAVQEKIRRDQSIAALGKEYVEYVEQLTIARRDFDWLQSTNTQNLTNWRRVELIIALNAARTRVEVLESNPVLPRQSTINKGQLI